ncbi:hypothetical protein J23TS9_05360 [Paenibacillus sp. J23TS9]|uniref:hypothetical protein n=1 Tax=Paenibacillus sp. J23TS9 TaxID=2807193 RepID=UPI001B2BD74B|nr:hypothetical protein [Paenibacillus sp. J23TS9]GIP25406.1 hypothetical protein J23TS9_05360 [Paenibacillus sp. J23TS9]
MNTQYMEKKLEQIREKIFEIITNQFSNVVVQTNYKAYIDKFYNSNNIGFAEISNTIFPKLDNAIFIASSQYNKQDLIVEVSVNGKNQGIDIKNLLDELEKEKIYVCMEQESPFYKLLRLNENLDFSEVPERDLNNPHMTTKKTCCERLIVEKINWLHTFYQVKKLELTDADKRLSEIYVEAEKEKLSGLIHLYTKFEPCLYCYGTLIEIKDKNPELQLKVYHRYVRDEHDRIMTMAEDMIARFDSEIVELFKTVLGNLIPSGLTPEQEKEFVIHQLVNYSPQ